MDWNSSPTFQRGIALGSGCGIVLFLASAVFYAMSMANENGGR